MSSAEQQARDLLDACGVEDAQSFTAGDVVALANYISERNQIVRESTERLERSLHLGTWLESILHIHFHDGCEWETVEGWLEDPTTFDISGPPFKADLDWTRKQAAELCRLRAQETRIREIAEYWRWINRDQPGASPILRQAGMQILAVLDTEEGQG